MGFAVFGGCGAAGLVPGVSVPTPSLVPAVPTLLWDLVPSISGSGGFDLIVVPGFDSVVGLSSDSISGLGGFDSVIGSDSDSVGGSGSDSVAGPGSDFGSESDLFLTLFFDSILALVLALCLPLPSNWAPAPILA